MRLISLELDNFRQHKSTKLTFDSGVTGVIGRNGSGKTTILEAIAWALYGSAAIRGKNDTVRCRTSEGGAKIQVRLTFELGGQAYYIERELNQARLTIDGKPARTGVTEVNNAVAKLLGMDYRAFFTSFFTEQKQLAFMAGMDGAQRAAAISRMLGYDRLTRARDAVIDERRGVQREIDALERGLADPEEIKTRKKDAEQSLEQAEELLKKAEKDKAKAQADYAKLKPEREVWEQKSKRHDELTRRVEMDTRDAARSRAQMAVLDKEIAELKEKTREIEKLAPQMKQFEEAEEEYRKLQDLQKHESERQKIMGQIAALKKDADDLERRMHSLSGAGEELAGSEKRVAEIEQLVKGLDQRIQSARDQWMSELKLLEAQNASLRQRLAELSENRSRIEQTGEGGRCPTCERELGGELAKVLGHFDTEAGKISTKLEDGLKRVKELQAEPQSLKQMRLEQDKTQAEYEEARKERELAARKAAELEACVRDLKSRHASVEALTRQLEKLPSGFSQQRFDELRDLGRKLKPSRDRARDLQAETKRLPQQESRRAEEEKTLKEKESDIASANAALAEVKFDPKEHERVVKAFETANQSLQTANILFERQTGELRVAKSALSAIEAEEKTYREKEADLKVRRKKRLYLQTLSESFERLRVELNDRIRPELEARSSSLVSDMTDGRYNLVELDDQYQAMIRDDGELKPIISGGEEDILNLALRLSISEMITERAGQPFSLLVLDEVFGSLDDTRRDNVVALLTNLKNRFDQIILITHVESIHDMVDNCVWVEYDERTKTSRLAGEVTSDQLPVISDQSSVISGDEGR